MGCHVLDVRQDPSGDIQRHTASFVVADVSLPFVMKLSHGSHSLFQLVHWCRLHTETHFYVLFDFDTRNNDFSRSLALHSV